MSAGSLSHQRNHAGEENSVAHFATRNLQSRERSNPLAQNVARHLLKIVITKIAVIEERAI